MHRYCRNFLSLAVALCLLPAATAVAALLVASSENFISVDPAESTITATLFNAGITDVAETLAQQAGIKVVMEKSLAQPISAKFENLPLELGIKRLFGPISSSLVFAEEKDREGKEVYRLEMVKIFPKGKMLSQQTVEFNGVGAVAGSEGAHAADGGDVTHLKTSGRPTSPEESGAAVVTGAKGSMPTQKTPGAMRQAIIEAHANLDVLRRRGQAEINRIDMESARIKRELSQNPPPEKRAELTNELTNNEKKKDQRKNLQSRIEIEEQRNIRETTKQYLK